jgi:hypothetical protein
MRDSEPSLQRFGALPKCLLYVSFFSTTIKEKSEMPPT